MTEFADRVLAWYDQHGRKNLPWHEPRTPYRVWVSEIMLQQTQVTTVIPYFERFMDRFPTVQALAEAPVESVMEHWSGLGYYARARNLHKAARQIVTHWQGDFPDTVESLEQLPGIGRSTAAAIVAQAWNRRAPILDGNVKRVLARHHRVDGWPGQTAVHNQLWALAEQHTPDYRARDYTQAVMDLGALLCTRTRPGCERCPVQVTCQGYQEGDPTRYPGRKPRTTKPEKHCWMLLVEDDQSRLLFQKRPPTGIWGGLWSLPEAERDIPLAQLPDHCAETLGLSTGQPRPGDTFRHTFSHYHLWITPVSLTLNSRVPDVTREPDLWHWMAPASAVNKGIPAPVRKLMGQL